MLRWLLEETKLWIEAAQRIRDVAPVVEDHSESFFDHAEATCSLVMKTKSHLSVLGPI